jgi:hypothetical protein
MYFVGLLCNLTGRKQTELYVHPHVETFPFILNTLNHEDYWVMLQMVGPFASKELAIGFYNCWVSQTRGRGSKLMRGIQLMEQYARRYDLTMWCQSEPASVHAQKRKRRKNDIVEVDDNSVQAMKDKRKLLQLQKKTKV